MKQIHQVVLIADELFKMNIIGIYMDLTLLGEYIKIVI